MATSNKEIEMIRKGDLIKAFEFEPIHGREDKYVIGAVDRVEEFCYVIKGETIIKDTAFGTDRMVEGVEIRVPKRCRLEYAGRITQLTDGRDFLESYFAEVA